jgi:phosphoribosylanthranilate isomerase
MNGVKIKICGLTRPEDVRAVNAAMPDYAGFIFYEKSRRFITPEQAARLRTALHGDIRTVGVFVDAPIGQIIGFLANEIITLVQLHGSEDNSYINTLRSLLPKLTIWQAFKIRSADDLSAAAESAADLVLLDGGAGEGRLFNWSLAQDFPQPFILAGGLTPENIPEAIVTLQPYAVDLSTGVETDGVKNADKIKAAVRAARRTPR